MGGIRDSIKWVLYGASAILGMAGLFAIPAVKGLESKVKTKNAPIAHKTVVSLLLPGLSIRNVTFLSSLESRTFANANVRNIKPNWTSNVSSKNSKAVTIKVNNNL